MSERLRNVLAAEHERLGWSQARMADAAAISRQSYAAIESGRSVPSTAVALRLALALGRDVGELFSLPDAPADRLEGTWSGTAPARPGRRARISRVGGRWIVHPCAEAHRPGRPAHGVVEDVDGSDVTVRLLAEAPPRAEVAAVGCDPAFGMVADALERERGMAVSWGQRGSRSALLALARGEVHVAGTHLRDPASGEWNGPVVRELVPFPCTRIAFATWEQGLLVRPEVRPRVAGAGDLAAPGLRLLNREEGSGSRALLDETLAEVGVEPEGVPGYATEARGHLAVADGIASGTADVGVAIRAAGVARELDVIPLRREAYELVVPDHFLDLPGVGAVLDILRRPGLRAQVEALGGYDGGSMGEEVS